MSVHQLFSQSCVETTSADPRAIGAAFDIEGRIVRPPMAVARTVEKIANGAAAHLSAEALGQLNTLGIEIERNEDGKFVSTKAVKPRTYFRPAG